MALQNDVTGPNKSLTSAVCSLCEDGFAAEERMVNSNGQILHERCFICVQCFQTFPDGLFYEFDGRRYCEHDFQTLFAPCCKECGEFIIGRVIRAMQASWHPECFRCEICNDGLAESGFIKNAGRCFGVQYRTIAVYFLQVMPYFDEPAGALCKKCNADEKTKRTGRYVCRKCHTYIPEGEHIMYMGEPVHPWHYNCYSCGKELDHLCRKRFNELYCLRCHDLMGTPICGACRRPIEERVVNALGKQWHVEHFVCAKCEKPFYGHLHYEKNGLPYCETHYNELFGELCFKCNHGIVGGEAVNAMEKWWCVNHFTCSGCDTQLTLRSKFHEFDMKPLCRKCYEKMPLEMKKRLRRAELGQPNPPPTKPSKK